LLRKRILGQERTFISWFFDSCFALLFLGTRVSLQFKRNKEQN